MKERSRTNVWFSVFSFSLIMLSQWAQTPHVAGQQPPTQPKTAEQAFKNIQVIKSMPAGQLQNSMSFMAASLGVDCTHCHTPPAMEKDDKPAKQTARRMLSMVNEINKNFETPIVNCATCHRGRTKPVGVPPLPSLNSPFVANPALANPEALPAVDEILERYIRALGGAQALDKITTRTRKGLVDVSGAHGSFELYEAAPNKSLFLGSMPPPLGPIQQGFDGSNGWLKNQGGVVDMSADGRVQAQRESAFYGDIKLKDQFKTMSVTGRERIDGRELYVVEGTRLDGQVERLFFEVQSGLLIRRQWQSPTYFGGLPRATDFDDYRKVGNVRLPFLIRRARGSNIFLQTVSEYKLNVKIDDAKFKKPATQK
jgi:photosynthetic reaction center cytochrome c subunit